MTEEKTFKVATVCFPIRGNEVLLARKTRKIGAGRWNGYGGIPDPGESLPECAVRELFEESGLSARVSDLTKIAVMNFHNMKSDGTSFVARVHFFTLDIWKGEYRATDEMADPTWFTREHLPLLEMMPADRVFLPLVLSGKKIVGSARYTPFQQALIGEVEMTEIADLPEL